MMLHNLKLYITYAIQFIQQVLFTLIAILFMTLEGYPIFIAMPIIFLAIITDGICVIIKELQKDTRTK